MTFEEAQELLAALQREGVDYVLVGAMAMAAQGLVRATRDVTFFVAPTPDNVDRLKRALRAAFGDDPSVEQITADDLAGEYPAIEYTPPHGRFSLDILARLGEAFSYEDLEFEEIDVEGVRVRVATPTMLWRMKKDTVRPIDRMDAQRIRDVFDLEDD
jgi:hypothetical protein